MNTRRIFLKNTGLLAGAALLGGTQGSCGSGKAKGNPLGGAKMKLRFKAYDLQLKHTFTIASNSRTTTPVMLVEIEYDGVIGYGEASMPPYLGESHETAAKFLSMVNLEQFESPFLLEDILAYVDSVMPGNYAAKASVDIALHDLLGKLVGQPLYKMWGLDPDKTPNTSFTIGIDTSDVVREKVEEAAPYKILKVKLGRGNDKEMINTIRSVTDKPLCVDVNQGWKDKHAALDMIHWLKEQGVVFVEQPMSKVKDAWEDMAWLTENSPLPTIADEALQTVADVLPLNGIYSGINIKLMKCGGLRAARKMMTIAHAMDMKVMIGCMTATSCAISAASQISPLVDWADLDGNLLISNDVFDGVKVINGKVTLKDRPGIGVVKL
ncbi:dipeptide epimerase [Carboxylicivirga sediminis]|uniref:Dipeptide epimerase n=1 Tax=Carboxylicivirga sediminis TaxID=2006564 RepID=A0A941EXV2_9BACT|nr:dipeptide epimerase [Carboxylicivirga sediminis]MBR8533991.1 dipeptide epimerase [Carboxylicivirga sediminis]